MQDKTSYLRNIIEVTGTLYKDTNDVRTVTSFVRYLEQIAGNKMASLEVFMGRSACQYIVIVQKTDAT